MNKKHKKQTKLFDDKASDITIKEEVDTDIEFENQSVEMHHDDGDDDYLSQSKKFKSSNNNMLSAKDKQLKRIAFKDKKKNLAHIMKKYPFLWDKNDEFYRNRQRRELAWLEIAEALNISVLETKALWKKLKDTHRYLSIKTKKKTDFNPNDFFVEPHNAREIMEDLSFLDDDYTTTVRDLRPLTDNSIFNESTPLPDPLNTDESNFGDISDSPYSHTDAAQTTQTKRAIAEPTPVGQITSSDFEKKTPDVSDTNALKHMHIWVQLEKLFEKLDDDRITDLNFSFVSETYKAILDKRKNQ